MENYPKIITFDFFTYGIKKGSFKNSLHVQDFSKSISIHFVCVYVCAVIFLLVPNGIINDINGYEGLYKIYNIYNIDIPTRLLIVKI